MTEVKICGLKSEAMIRSIAHLPIDQIGFMFAKSRRQVTPALAGAMIAALREASAGEAPLTVGVFVNPTMEEVARTLTAAALDVIQLHGGESPDFCRQVKDRFGVQVWKVVPVSGELDVAATIRSLESFAGIVDAFLLDTYDPVVGGGSGKTFSWDCIPAFQDWTERSGSRLIVAGGLNPDNIGGLVTGYRPAGVDVSSGVETDGEKDADKIAAFVERVKSQ